MDIVALGVVRIDRVPSVEKPDSPSRTGVIASIDFLDIESSVPTRVSVNGVRSVSQLATNRGGSWGLLANPDGDCERENSIEEYKSGKCHYRLNVVDTCGRFFAPRALISLDIHIDV